MINMPEIKLGIVAVSRDCFPMTLSENRRKAVVAAYDGPASGLQNILYHLPLYKNYHLT